MSNRQTVLFVCTGNYYRSRFAEALFNHHAASSSLAWVAQSKGFRPHLSDGDLSPQARTALTRLGIPSHHTRSNPAPLALEDLVAASIVVIINEREHRPMLENAFPGWTHRVQFWNIHDIDVELPSTALPKLERDVLLLIESLGDGHALGTRNSLAMEF